MSVVRRLFSMKEMNLTSFRDYIEGAAFEWFSFSTEENVGIPDRCYFAVDMFFDKLNVIPTFDMVLLTKGEQRMYLGSVRKATVEQHDNCEIITFFSSIVPNAKTQKKYMVKAKKISQF